MRQIAPEQFAPMYRDPNAPQHKLPPPATPASPKAVAVAPTPSTTPDAAAPSRDKPYGVCDPAAHDFVACLGGAANLADKSVEAAEHAVLAGLGRRPGVNPVVADGAARGLRAAGEAWRMLRDRECADLPLIEAGLNGSLYERRLVCRIRRDIDRTEFLKARYGGE